MKFKYPKRKKSFNLIIGILWIGLGVFALWESEARTYEYIWLVLGLFYFGLALYMQVASYVTITKEAIIKNNLVPIKIPLTKITKVNEFANEITIEMDNKKMKIHKNNIQKNQLPIFREAIAKIEKQYVSGGAQDTINKQ